MSVHVLQGLHDLDCVALNFELVQSLSPPKQLIHRLVAAQLQENVHILVVLEEVLKTDDMAVDKRSVDFNFT